jgi:tripartite-type tricarboxylate transporter receptor subunit TctC
MMKRNAAILGWCAGVSMAGSAVVSAQDYPLKPIRIITAGAGGGSDFDSRQIAQGISGPLGQSVIVDNRTTALAAEAVSKAPPDGYTLLVSGATLWIIPLLRKTPWDVSDFAPISLIERTVNIVAVHPSVPVKSMKELIALARARPGALNYSSGSIGGPAHLASELFKSMTGVNILHIPYSGTAPAITAVISGEVQLAIFDSGIVTPHMKSGKLRGLAVTSAEPSALTPGMPTVAASGLPGYEMTGMTGILAPARTPAAIINRLNQEIVRVLNQPDVKARFLAAEAEIVANSPEQFAAIIKADIVKSSKVIKDAGIKVE